MTQPPAQPNASLDVKAQAGQVPQTPQQVIQKTLAKDAGIATSLPAGQPPLRMPPATPQVSKLTTNPGADRIALNPQVSPPVSPRSFKDAAKAATATVGAKIATQRASDAAITAATLVRRSMDTKAATVAAIDLSKSAEATAKAKAEEFNQTRIAASRVLGSQTASPDEKAQAEASVRTAAEAKALAEREAAAAKAKADAAAKAKAELDALASRAAAEAEVAKAKADEQAKQAIEAQKKLVSAETAVAEQPKMLPPPSGAPAVSGEAPAAAPAEKPTVITGEGQAATAAPEAAVVEKPAAGSKVMPILALGAVALLAYAAMRKKGPSLNAAPTLIEDLD